MDAIDGWHAYVRSPDVEALLDLLDPEITFDSPVVHATQRGSTLAHAYLSAATSILNGDSFRYIGEWRGTDGAVLEFVTEIDGIVINGVDIIRLTGDGQRIAGFKVMIRPLKAVNMIHQLMGAELARAAVHRAPSALSSASGENGSSPEPG